MKNMKKKLVGLAVAAVFVAGTSTNAMAWYGSGTNNNTNTNTNNATVNNNNNQTSKETNNSNATATATSNGRHITKTQTGSNSYNGGYNTSIGIGAITLSEEKAVSKSSLRANTSHNRVNYNGGTPGYAYDGYGSGGSTSSQNNNMSGNSFQNAVGIVNAAQNSGNMSNVQQSNNVSVSGGVTIH